MSMWNDHFILVDDQIYLILYCDQSLCILDWPSADTLLHVWSEISISASLTLAFENMRAVRRRVGADSAEEQALRASFLKIFGASFRLWLLRSCSFTYGARRQLMWSTYLAKFYGLSRTGIRTLSQLGLLSPLTSLDRHWKSMLHSYGSTIRFDFFYILSSR